MQRLAIFVIVIMPLGAHGFPAPKGPELTLADFLVGRWELTGKDRKVASSTYFVEFTADGGYKVLSAGVEEGGLKIGKYQTEGDTLVMEQDCGFKFQFRVLLMSSRKLIFESHTTKTRTEFRRCD